MGDVALPHDERSERSLLGSVFLAPSILEHAQEMLAADAFYLDRHRAIWRAMVALRAAHRPIDYQTVAAELEDAGELEKTGGLAYLAALDQDLPVSSLPAVRGYAEVIRDRYARRRLIVASVELRERATNGAGTSEAIRAAAETLEQIDRDRATAGVDENLLDLLVNYEPYDERPRDVGIPTGLRDLDEKVRGLRPGQLWVCGATPGMGKTAWGLQVARSAAAAGKVVRYHALEMTSEELMFRMICQESGVPFSRLIDGDLSESEKSRAVEANISLTAATGDRIVIRAAAGLNAGQIAAESALQKLRQGLDLLIVDNLGLVASSGRGENIRVDTGKKCEAMKGLAMQLDVPVLLFHHLSRAHISEGRMPRIQDFIETQAIERDAHVGLLLWRPDELVKGLSGEDREKAEEKLEKSGMAGKAAFIVGKNRNGPKGIVKTVWLGERMRFYDLDERQPPHGAQERVPF